MPELGIPPHRVVFVSGIGCAGRFAYYMDTYGMHGIHGRAPALATGLAAARGDLSIWVITGDGDALSIGGNHLIHALRRNVPVKILMFNNQIYGLTKGQASPTSERGKVTKSTPFGAHDEPFNPLALALGAGATFAARTIDRDREHMTAVLRAAAEHRGALVRRDLSELPGVQRRRVRAAHRQGQAVFNRIPLEHGEPIRFGPDFEHGVVRAPDGRLVVAAGDDPAIVVHDAHRDDPAQAFALARLADSPSDPTPIGVFRAVERPVGIAEAGASWPRPALTRARRPRRPPARRRHLDRRGLGAPVHRSLRLQPQQRPRGPAPAVGRVAGGERGDGGRRRVDVDDADGAQQLDPRQPVPVVVVVVDAQRRVGPAPQVAQTRRIARALRLVVDRAPDGALGHRERYRSARGWSRSSTKASRATRSAASSSRAHPGSASIVRPTITRA